LQRFGEADEIELVFANICEADEIELVYCKDFARLMK
jgi:hypothetical protein